MNASLYHSPCAGLCSYQSRISSLTIIAFQENDFTYPPTTFPPAPQLAPPSGAHRRTAPRYNDRTRRRSQALSDGSRSLPDQQLSDHERRPVVRSPFLAASGRPAPLLKPRRKPRNPYGKLARQERHLFPPEVSRQLRMYEVLCSSPRRVTRISPI
jgi:hypothetical protein